MSDLNLPGDDETDLSMDSSEDRMRGELGLDRSADVEGGGDEPGGSGPGVPPPPD